MTSGLPVSRLVDVTVNLSPSLAQYANVNSCLIVGSSDVISVNERIRSYASLAEVGAQFSDSDPEYLAASLFFGQSPQPTELLIGRWAAGATNGLLECAALTTANTLLSAWTAITDGGFSVAVDGGAADDITGLNFSAAVNLNGVAAIISAALTGATCAYDSVFNRFVITSATAGATSSIGYLGAPSTGTAIQTMMGGTLASGAESVNGIAAETALEAVEILDTNALPWYMMTIVAAELVDDDNEAVAGYIEGDSIPHIYGITTSDSGALSAAATTDIGYILQQLEYQRTIVQYSSDADNPYTIASLFGLAATVDFTAADSTITVMFKTEPGITPESISSSQANALDGKNYTYYANYDNGTAIIVNGTMANGYFFDEIQGSDWFANAIQTDVFNVLRTQKKVPQTDAGVNLLTTTVNGTCQAAVNNGLVGPGTWEFGGFGQLAQGQFLPTGYYVYAPSVASQTQAARAARQAPTLQVAAIFAGAIQQVSIIVNVNR